MMEQKELKFSKKRDPGTVISDSFLFLRLHFSPLSKLTLTYVFPFILLYAVASVFLQMKIVTSIDLTNEEQLLQNIVPVYGNLFLLSLFGIFVQSLYIGAFYTYVEASIKKGGGGVKISEISHLLFSNTLLALGASLVVSFIVLAGIILCIIPGIYFANSLSLSFFIVIMEKKGIGNAISRSFQLVSVRWWDTFLINLAGLFFIIVLILVVSIPSAILGFSTSFLGLKAGSQVDYPTWYWVLTGLSTILSNLFYIVFYTFYVFQYYSILEYLKPAENSTRDSAGG